VDKVLPAVRKLFPWTAVSVSCLTFWGLSAMRSCSF